MTGVSEHWRLGHRPALDGMRGIAIAMVTCSHFAAVGTPLKWIGGLGVTVFFVLSGFLITSLLLEEHQAAGRIDLKRFFARRVRRLLPAMVVVVAAVSVTAAFIEGFTNPVAVVAALTYGSNWVQLAGGDMSGFGHFWSLAVEEQFYLTWPLAFLLLVRVSPRRQVQILGTIVAAAACIPILIGPSPWYEVYMRTDARAVSLLAGCLLAFVLHLKPERLRPTPGVASASLVLIGASASVSLVFTLMLAPLVTTVAAVAMIRQATTTRSVPWLHGAVLRWLGRRSYGMYLWQSPIIAVMGRELDGWVLVSLTLPLVLVVTELSWRHVELPFLRRRRTTGRVSVKRTPQLGAVRSHPAQP